MDNMGGLRLPFPSFEIFFKCMEINNTNFKAKCKLCLPKTNILSCHVKASSNLRKHLQKKHPNSIKKLQEQNIFRRKRKSFNESETEINRKTIKQSNIYICSDVGETSTISQDTVDQLILNFVVNSLQPITICDKSSKDGVAFNKLITGLQPEASVMCSKTLKSRLHSALIKTKQAFIETIEQVLWVAITVDCWSAAKRSFIGVTAHWIDLSSLERRQAALACKQLKGHHTYNVLAKELEVIFEEYKLEKKISGITTDNGSNFGGVLKVLGEDDIDYSYDEDISDVEFIEITKILAETQHQTTQENTELVVLPSHMRCASHTLNLIASRDIQKALQSPHLKTIWRQTFSKLQALWNKQNTSTLSADIIKQHFDVYLKTPTTRWNSLYEACNQLKVLINNSSGMDKLHRVCDALDIPRLEQNEVVFLREYVDVMKPLASALNLLQRENNMYMGYLLPTLYQTVATLNEIKTSHQLQYCIPLVCVLIDSIQLRFQSIWWKRSFVISSCIHPKFKLDWLKSPKKEEAYKWVLEELDLNYVDLVVVEKVESSPSEYFDQDENDFFQFPTTSNSNSASEFKRNFDRFLEDNSRNLEMLNKHQLIKQIFLKYNTSLPSSASVVGIFSVAADVFKTKGYALTDSNFEMQLLLRLNVEYSPLA